MNERIQAAAKALADENGWTSYIDAEKVLTAVDAITFHALEKLAAQWDYEWNNCEPGDQAAFGKSLAADELRELITTLKGDAK